LDQNLHKEKEKVRYLTQVFENSFSFVHTMALTMQNGITDKLKEVQSAIYDRGDSHWANLQKEGQALFKDYLAARGNMTAVKKQLDVSQLRGKKAWADLKNQSDPALLQEIDALYANQTNLSERLAESTWRARELADQMTQEEIAQAGAEWMQLNASLAEAKEAFQSKYDDLLSRVSPGLAQEVQSSFAEYEELKGQSEKVQMKLTEANRNILESTEKKEIQKLLGARNANTHLKELLNQVGMVGNLTLADARRRANKKVIEELDNATAQQVILSEKLGEVVKADEQVQAQLKLTTDPTLFQDFNLARSDLNEIKAVARALESDAVRFYSNIKDTRDQVIDMEKKVWAVGTAQAMWAFHDVQDMLSIAKKVGAIILDQAKAWTYSLKNLVDEEAQVQQKIMKRRTAVLKDNLEKTRNRTIEALNTAVRDWQQTMHKKSIERGQKVAEAVESLRHELYSNPKTKMPMLYWDKFIHAVKEQQEKTKKKAVAAGLHPDAIKEFETTIKKGVDSLGGFLAQARKRVTAAQADQKALNAKAKAFTDKVINAVKAISEQSRKIEAEKRRPEAKLFRQLAQEAAIAKKTK